MKRKKPEIDELCARIESGERLPQDKLLEVLDALLKPQEPDEKR